MADTSSPQDLTLAKIAADIVVAYVSRNPMDAGEVPWLTKQIKAALMTGEPVEGMEGGEDEPPAHEPVEAAPDYRPAPARAGHDHAGHVHKRSPRPAVAIGRSVDPDYVTCLEDGRRFRSLKRHLRHEHGMTPEEYRAKWGLPEHYPMVAPNYSAVRTDLAKKHGLGRRPASDAPRRESYAPRVAAE